SKTQTAETAQTAPQSIGAVWAILINHDKLRGLVIQSNHMCSLVNFWGFKPAKPNREHP
ncbi:hypothetical protein TorRG33x02_236780, partial [Trema orientale]